MYVYTVSADSSLDTAIA